jgi:hypothetical protein
MHTNTHSLPHSHIWTYTHTYIHTHTNPQHLKRRGSNSKSAQRQLAQNLQYCKARGSDVFDIAEEHGALIDWKAAAMELNLMNEYQTPHEMLRALIACVRVVFDSVRDCLFVCLFVVVCYDVCVCVCVCYCAL